MTTEAALRPVLLTVSGRIPDGLDSAIAEGERPRADYRELADALEADVLARPDPAGRSGLRRLAVRGVGENVAMAWSCWRRRRQHDVVVTDGEQIGLPLAALLSLDRLTGRRRPRHVMIVHIMSVPKKARLFRALRLRRGIDVYIVYCSAQRDHLVAELGVSAAQVVLIPFMVDTRFFQPSGAAAVSGRPLVVTAGLECRDYPTLLRAVDGLAVDVVIGAASFWSKRGSGIVEADVPPNVRIDSFDLRALRALYDQATLVVMPLQPVQFQAGITTILEAMSMSRAVVCSRTPGQTDTIVDGVTGVYVPPGDVGALRSAITALVDDESTRERIGSAAREWAIAEADLDVYVRHVRDAVEAARRS